MSKEVYVDVAAMAPLSPQQNRAHLSELSVEIFKEAGALGREVPDPTTRKKVVALVRSMNSYYSNLIEGHKTYPRDIERAVRQEFSPDPQNRLNQKLSLAHMEVEQLMEERLREGAISPYSLDFLFWLHREFYERLPEELRLGKTVSGKPYHIEPGKIRNFNVDVGQHSPPHHEALPDFLKRFESFYQPQRFLAADRLIEIAAAHQRLAWIHPFGDGNGRVARLFSHALFIAERVDCHGLWTLSRGLAREKAAYYVRLANADQPKLSALDGRGNLTDRGLSEFCIFFLEVVLDQIRFMRGILDFGSLEERVSVYLAREELGLDYKDEITRLLKRLVRGEIPRAEVQEVTGKKETVSRAIIKTAQAAGLIDSPSERGKLSLAFPAKVLETYFPKLYTDLPVN